jgi:hypothetical protein
MTIFGSEDWESDIRDVQIEACAPSEDPSGFKAVFYLTDENKPNFPRVNFTVGASLLKQRANSLSLAGYAAPMTKKALDLFASRAGVPA